jgi:hypothetical protein
LQGLDGQGARAQKKVHHGKFLPEITGFYANKDQRQTDMYQVYRDVHFGKKVKTLSDIHKNHDKEVCIS